MKHYISLLVLLLSFSALQIASASPLPIKTILREVVKDYKRAQIQPAYVQSFTDMKATNDPNVSITMIDISEHSTRMALSVTLDVIVNGAYCLWDVGDPSSFHLVDLDTDKIYRLEKQISKIGSCNRKEWYSLYNKEKVDIQLFFPPLPKEVKRIQLIEGTSDKDTSSSEFPVIELTHRD